MPPQTRDDASVRGESPLRPDTLIAGDCVALLGALPEPIADLIIADPPYNIGYDYGAEYSDDLDYDKYVEWTRRWMTACVHALKPHGAFFTVIGDDYAAEARLIGRDLRLTLRNWIIWHYTFGQNTKAKFARAHTHILYFTRHPGKFVFNDAQVRVLSDRQTVYGDRRADARGKLPDDVWWEFPRVCGTFHERNREHPCQMPESLLARIIRAACNPGDLVLDPFVGSGSTAAAALKLGRHYVGIDLSRKFIGLARRRIADAERALHPRRTSLLSVPWTSADEEQLANLYREINIPLATLNAEPELMSLFAGKFLQRTGPAMGYTQEAIADKLHELEHSARLPRLLRAEPPRRRVLKRKGA
jgi:site-specific DNA-methyltransferase (adenine-specific)